MNKRALYSIFSWLAAAAVFAVILFVTAVNCINSYVSFPLNDYWIELLVNYSAGPIRRGLLGEILEKISFIPIQVLWLSILVICYAFIYSVLVLRMRALRIPFIMQIGVYLSPLLCYCLYFSYYFVNRDIFLLAGALLILLPVSSVYRNRGKAGTRCLAFCSLLLTAVGSVMLFSHAGSCTLLVLPLLLMALVCRNAVDFVLFTLLPAAVFILEILTIQNFMSVLSPDGMMAVLDDIKSRYPIVPGRMDDLILVTLRSLSAAGQAHWREVTAANLGNLPSICLDAALLTAAAVLPLVLVLFRGVREAGSSGLRYMKISAIFLASIAPMALTFVAVDFFRWRNWACFMLLCSVLLLCRSPASGVDSEGSRAALHSRLRYGAAVVISLISAAVVCRDLSVVVPARYEVFDKMLNLSGRYRIMLLESPNDKTMIDVPGFSWELVMEPGQAAADVGVPREYGSVGPHLTSICFGTMHHHFFDSGHRRLFMSGYLLISTGSGRFRRPHRSFGVVVSDGKHSIYYPTVAYSGTADIGGYKASIDSMYDDYVLIPPYMNAGKLKVYNAVYTTSGEILQCADPVLEL